MTGGKRRHRPEPLDALRDRPIGVLAGKGLRCAGKYGEFLGAGLDRSRGAFLPPTVTVSSSTRRTSPVSSIFWPLLMFCDVSTIECGWLYDGISTLTLSSVTRLRIVAVIATVSPTLMLSLAMP
jgi:hypothetical protein